MKTVDKMKKSSYKAFGLKVVSEVALPELIEVSIPEGLQGDVDVKITDLTITWLKQAIPNKYFVIKEKLCLFKVPGVAIYLIQNGSEIFVSPLEDSNEDQIRLYILGTCMGAILMQRKILPLHGSAVAIGGKAYAIVGDSGAGKSTLASAFLDKGFQLLSDDVIPVSFSEHNTPIVTPAYPQQKLWLESLTRFGMEAANYRPIFKRENKFTVPVSLQFVDTPLPLAGIFELIKTEKHEIEISPIRNMERFYTLFQHTYRNFFVTQSGLMDWHFKTSAHVINKIDLYRLERPTSRFTANELADLILEKININKEEERYEQ